MEKINKNKILNYFENIYKSNNLSKKIITKLKSIQIDTSKKDTVNSLFYRILDEICQYFSLTRKNIKFTEQEIIYFLKQMQVFISNAKTKQNCKKTPRNVIFVDASIREDFFYFGLFIKKEDKYYSFKLDSKLFNICNSNDAEKFAILVAICFAKYNNMQNVIILNDNQEAVNYCNTMFNCINISWIPREINEVADSLSKNDIVLNKSLEEILPSNFLLKELFAKI